MAETSNTRRRIAFPREVLLVEIERRCRLAHCNGRARVGLTKEDARRYTGFECERCERWNEDSLHERDIPDWWEELKITGLDGVRAVKSPEMGEDDASEVVKRMSEAWRAERGRRELQGAGGDSFEREVAGGEIGGRSIDDSFDGEDSF